MIEGSELQSDVLLDLAGPDLYRNNAFRITGLSVDASTREIARHTDKMRMMEKLGVEGEAFGNSALPLQDAPDSDAIRAALQRLHDPERRLVDELFWFWPHFLGQSGKDEALVALMQGDVPAAAGMWTHQEREGSVSNISMHNLAVLAHATALDLEHLDKLTQARTRERDRCWKEGLKRWRALFEDEGFWSRVVERIRELDDPRLTAGTARRMRASLPLALLTVNTGLAVQAAERGDGDEARRHVQTVKKSGFPAEVVEKAWRRSMEPLRERIQMTAKLAEEKADADPERANKPARRLMKQAKPLLAAVDCLLEPGHPMRSGLHDEIALRVLGCQISYGNETEDWKESVSLVKAGLKLVEGDGARARLEQNLKIVTSNQEQAKTWGVCWYCQEGKPEDGLDTEVKVCGNVQRTPTFEGVRITWQQGTIGVPRCTDCDEAHVTGFMWFPWYFFTWLTPIVALAALINFVPRFRKYPTPRIGAVLGFATAMVVGFIATQAYTHSDSISALAAVPQSAGPVALASRSGSSLYERDLPSHQGYSEKWGAGLEETAASGQQSQQMISQLRQNWSDDELWGDLGDAFTSDGDLESAMGCYAVALLLDSGDSEWQGHNPELSAAVRILQQLGVQDDEVIGDLGDAASSLGDREAAVTLYQMAASLDPGDAEWAEKVITPPVGVEEAAPSAGQSAVEQLTQQVSNNWRDDEAWGDLGDAHAAAGNGSMAEGCYAVALLIDSADGEWTGHNPNLSRAVTTLRQLNVTDDELIGDLGDTASNRGESEAAQALYGLALELDPSDTEWQGKLIAAPAAMEEATPAELPTPPAERPTPAAGQSAVERLTRQVRNNVSDDEAWGDLGDAHAAAGNGSTAEGCYAVALMIDPSDGEWQGHSPSLARAVTVLRQLNVTDDELIGDLGDVAGGRGESTAARALYELALELDPSDGEWQGKVSGTTSAPSPEPEVAPEPMRLEGLDTSELAGVDVYDAEIWGQLGALLAEEGEADLAESCYAVARLVDPGDGRWQDRNPQLWTAVIMLREVRISDDEWIGDMGDTAQSLGNPRAAQLLYELALELDPSDSEWVGHVGSGPPTPILPPEVMPQAEILRWNWGNASLWGDLGDAFATIDDPESADQCYAIALLLEPNNSVWLEMNPDLSGAVPMLRRVGLRDDEIVGGMGDEARRMGAEDAAHSLYLMAVDMDGVDLEWRYKAGFFQSFGNPALRAVAMYLVGTPLLGLLLAFAGARYGRRKRQERGRPEEVKKTKPLSWRMQFPPVKAKLDAGWELGETPAEAAGS